ncbi:MAG: polyphosphate polymerase domain-containing protein [Muribaculaceae bacterium]|nr:polyphosphate polymerase domain-containing protein [Muribaculaceae bacterium]
MKEVIGTYRPITLEEMSGIRLMNRIDTKFVTTVPMLIKLLEMARDQYRVQETGGLRLIPYHTVYFDTEPLDMYTTHQNGALPRKKVRVRSYVKSDLHFLEVKKKNNHRRTKKNRMKVTGALAGRDFASMNFKADDVAQFMQERYVDEAGALRPTLENTFDRITLVNNDRTERLTIDTSLKFHNVVTGNDRDLTGLAIIELKRDGLCYSPILEMLLKLRIKPQGFSKCCMGIAFTDPQAKRNRFKPRMRLVERLLKNLNNA